MSISIEKLYFARVEKCGVKLDHQMTREKRNADNPYLHPKRSKNRRSSVCWKTRDPKGRIRNHIGKREHNHKGNWIESLRKLGLTPVVHFIDNVPTAEWSFWEQHWIQTFLVGVSNSPTWTLVADCMHASHLNWKLNTKLLTEAVCEDMRDKAKINMNKPEVKMKHSEAVMARWASQKPKTKMQNKRHQRQRCAIWKLKAF